MSCKCNVPCDINTALFLSSGLQILGLDGLSEDLDSVSEILEPPRIGDHLIFFNNVSFISFVDCLLGSAKWLITKLTKDSVCELDIVPLYSSNSDLLADMTMNKLSLYCIPLCNSVIFRTWSGIEYCQ